jgi:hypothetical protein
MHPQGLRVEEGVAGVLKMGGGLHSTEAGGIGETGHCWMFGPLQHGAEPGEVSW